MWSIHVNLKPFPSFVLLPKFWTDNSIGIPNKHQEPEPQIKKWNISEINRDYKKYPDFIDNIRKYKAFFNLPCNTEDYQRVAHDCYNTYHPINYESKAGDISNTLDFLKHIFGGNAFVRLSQDRDTKELNYMECAILGDPFTVALDYLTLMYRHPTQMLPVPCLVSPENNTGKSSFLKWLKDIYGSNCTIVGNEEFKMSFNSHYIAKFIIGIDEGFIAVEKKTEKERIKKLATDEKQFLQFKGVDVQEIDFYGKLIICSNDADKLMKIEEGEIRWFIIKVPPLKSEDPKKRDKMRDEIPAWLHFLKHREIVHPNEGRAWFNPKYLETDQLKVIINATKSNVEKELSEFISDMFLTFRLDSIRIHLDHIVEQLNKQSKWRVNKNEIKDFLKKKKGMKPLEVKHIKVPLSFDDLGKITYLTGKHRAYEFLVKDWLTPEELEEFEASEIDQSEPVKKEWYEQNEPAPY